MSLEKTRFTPLSYLKYNYPSSPEKLSTSRTMCIPILISVTTQSSEVFTSLVGESVSAANLTHESSTRLGAL